MATAEEQLSPEEKLLKAIQSGGPAKPGKPGETRPPVAAPATTASAAAPAAKEPAARPEAPPLKLARDGGRPAAKDAKAAAPAATATATAAKPGKPPEPSSAAAPKAAAEAAAAAPPAPPAPPAAAPGARRPREIGIGAVNRFLFAAVIVVLCLAGWEVWNDAGAAERAPAPAPAPGEAIESVATALPLLASQGPTVETAPIENLLRQFAERPIFGPPPARRPKEEGSKGTTPPPSTQLDLIGFTKGSGGQTEAIVLDKATSRLLVLGIGQTARVGNQDLTVEEIGSDQVTLTDGPTRMVVK